MNYLTSAHSDFVDAVSVPTDCKTNCKTPAHCFVVTRSQIESYSFCQEKSLADIFEAELFLNLWCPYSLVGLTPVHVPMPSLNILCTRGQHGCSCLPDCLTLFSGFSLNAWTREYILSLRDAMLLSQRQRKMASPLSCSGTAVAVETLQPQILVVGHREYFVVALPSRVRSVSQCQVDFDP